MKDLTKKIRFIFLPCLAVSALTIIVYTFLHWLLFIHFHICSLQESVLNVWVPFGVWILVIFTVLRKPARYIIPNISRWDPQTNFQIGLFFCLMLPICIAQYYLESETGKMTRIADISHISDIEATKYYEVDKYYINKTGNHCYYVRSFSGKQNSTLVFNEYVVFPILKDSTQTQYNGVSWLAVKYHDEVLRNVNDGEREEEKHRQEFEKKYKTKIEQTNFNEFVYLENEKNSDDLGNYNKAIELGNTYSSKNTYVLSPVNERFDDRNAKYPPWIFGSFAVGALIMLIMLMFIKVDMTGGVDKVKTETLKV